MVDAVPTTMTLTGVMQKYQIIAAPDKMLIATEHKMIPAAFEIKG